MRAARFFAIAVISSLFSTSVFAASSAPPAVNSENIKKATDKAKEWLYKQQKPDGTWEYQLQKWHEGQQSGQTALVVYALLSAGESHQDPRIDKAIEYIRKTDTTGVYALGLRMQIWAMIPPTPHVRAVATKDAKILLQSMIRTG